MAHSLRFNRDWLSKADYKPWLASVEMLQRHIARMCMKTFSLSNMGEIAVKSPASGKETSDCCDPIPESIFSE